MKDKASGGDAQPPKLSVHCAPSALMCRLRAAGLRGFARWHGFDAIARAMNVKLKSLP
jgi:hypothetical protein